MLGLVQRRDKTDKDAPAAQVYLEVLENVRTATIKPIIAAKVKVGAQFFTDEYNIYHFTKTDYDHRTVNHGAGEYARRDRTVRVFTATRWTSPPFTRPSTLRPDSTEPSPSGKLSTAPGDWYPEPSWVLELASIMALLATWPTAHLQGVWA